MFLGFHCSPGISGKQITDNPRLPLQLHRRECHNPVNLCHMNADNFLKKLVRLIKPESLLLGSEITDVSFALHMDC